MHTNVHSLTIYIAKTLKQSKCHQYMNGWRTWHVGSQWIYYIYWNTVVVESLSRVRLFVIPWLQHARFPCPWSEILLSHKRNEIVPLASTQMNIEITILSEISQKEKEKDHIISLYVKLKKWYKWTYLQNRDRLADIENKFMVTKEESGWERDKVRVWD